jgi:hypothetical protein
LVLSTSAGFKLDTIVRFQGRLQEKVTAQVELAQENTRRFERIE